MIKKYTNFEENSNEVNTQAKGLDIKNEYTKLINDPSLNTLDLGVVDGVSDTDITNIQQTYKDSQVKVVDGHYILIIAEGTILKYSDFEHLNEDGFRGFFKHKDKEPYVSSEVNKILHSTNGIASELGIGGKEPREYDQIMFAYDNDGFDNLKTEWKSMFIKMVDMATIIVQSE